MGEWSGQGEKGQRRGFAASRALLALVVAILLVGLAGTIVWLSSTDGSTHRTVKVPYGLDAPRLLQRPADPTISTSASFIFGTTLPEATFHCRLDVQDAAICSRSASASLPRGAATYEGLARGRHCFFVYSSSILGESPTTAYCWTIAGPPETLKVVAGSAQSTVVNSAFGERFSLRVLDASGTPVPGIRVAFSARAPLPGASTPSVTSRGAAHGPHDVLVSSLASQERPPGAPLSMASAPGLMTSALPSGTFARCDGGNPSSLRAA